VHIAPDPTVPAEEGVAFLKAEPSKWEEMPYFVYGQFVRFAFETEHWNFQQLLEHKDEFDSLRIKYLTSLH
jgi:hypothetical protein